TPPAPPGSIANPRPTDPSRSPASSDTQKPDRTLMSSLSLPQPLTPDAFDPDAVRAHIADAMAAVDAYPDPAVWIHRATPDQVQAQLDRALFRRAAGEDLP